MQGSEEHQVVDPGPNGLSLDTLKFMGRAFIVGYAAYLIGTFGGYLVAIAMHAVPPLVTKVAMIVGTLSAS